jgi:RNA polymerase sigma-70 factor (ECF subfamily)
LFIYQSITSGNNINRFLHLDEKAVRISNNGTISEITLSYYMSGKENHSPDDDDDLVSRCKRGDLEAFETLVIKHQKKMLNIAFRMAGNYEDACEIVQDAFLSAYKGIGNFEKRSRFSTWLYTIVIITSRNRLRQIRSRSVMNSFRWTTRWQLIAAACVLSWHRIAPRPPNSSKKSFRQESRDAMFEERVQRGAGIADIQGFSYDDKRHVKDRAGTVKSRSSGQGKNMKNCLQKVPGDER